MNDFFLLISVKTGPFTCRYSRSPEFSDRTQKKMNSKVIPKSGAAAAPKEHGHSRRLPTGIKPAQHPPTGRQEGYMHSQSPIRPSFFFSFSDFDGLSFSRASDWLGSQSEEVLYPRKSLRKAVRKH
jgi:hypothetical protein